MVEEAVKSYRVAYERDKSGWWIATVRGVRGCHTQGRTVDEARRRIREALGLSHQRVHQLMEAEAEERYEQLCSEPPRVRHELCVENRSPRKR